MKQIAVLALVIGLVGAGCTITTGGDPSSTPHSRRHHRTHHGHASGGGRATPPPPARTPSGGGTAVAAPPVATPVPGNTSTPSTTQPAGTGRVHVGATPQSTTLPVVSPPPSSSATPPRVGPQKGWTTLPANSGDTGGQAPPGGRPPTPPKPF